MINEVANIDKIRCQILRKIKFMNQCRLVKKINYRSINSICLEKQKSRLQILFTYFRVD